MARPVVTIEASSQKDVESRPKKVDIPKRKYIEPREKNDANKAEKDVSKVALSTTLEKSHKLRAEEKATGLEAIVKAYEQNNAKGEVMFLSYFLDAKFQDTTLAEPFTITQDNKPQTFTRIKGRADETHMICVVDGKDVNIPLSDILTAQIQSMFKNPEVRALFPEEAEIIDAYLDSLSKKPTGKAESIDKAKLAEISKKSGLVSSESFIAFGTANHKEVVEADLADGAEASKKAIAEANQEFNKRVDTALEKMKDSTVADPVVCDEVLQIILPESVQGSMLVIETQIQTITEQISALGGKDVSKQTELESKLLELNNFKGLITESQEHFAEGNMVQNLYGQVQRGEVSTETVQKLDSALQKNDLDGIVKCFQNDKNIDEKTKKRLENINFKAIGKWSTLTALGMVFMLLWKAVTGGVTPAG